VPTQFAKRHVNQRFLKCLFKKSTLWYEGRLSLWPVLAEGIEAVNNAGFALVGAVSRGIGGNGGRFGDRTKNGPLPSHPPGGG
jgi:hypothetical protein